MATLSRPGFRLDPLTGIPYKSRVTAIVDVELTPSDIAFINAGFPLTLKSSFWGDDGQFNGGDDFLFSFTPQNITASGTYTFSEVVYDATFNEDDSFFDDWDEIYNSFTLSAKTEIKLPFPFGKTLNIPLGSADTSVLEGYFYSNPF